MRKTTIEKRSFLIKITSVIILFVLLCGVSFAKPVTVRVALLHNQYAVKISNSNGLTAKDAYELKKITKSPKNIVVKVYKGKIYVNKIQTNSKFVYIVSKNIHHTTYLNGVPYRGYYLVGFNNRGRLQVINYVSLEDYIAGVLGGEVSSRWPAESLKTQAVAARTYVMYKLTQSKDKVYDVVNDTGDQMYIGVRGESAKFRRVVKQTSSQILTRGGNVICTYYHSNCGGGTSDSWNVFKKDRGGLTGVKCPYCAGAPNSSWGKTLYTDTIRYRLKKNGYNIGKIFSMKPYSKGKLKRIIYLEIKHSYGTSYVFASEFRRIMGYRTIKSTKFDVYPKRYITYRHTKKIAVSRGGVALTSSAIGGTFRSASKKLQVPTYFYFSGAGWGHGVGMCQWGARGMALDGYNYKQILMHYYPGTKITKAGEEKN
ncbi:MAG: SpoIID/LytB domain-containing protein [Candidatus Eremiobacteraeota bacterium]|nr:SpoIID/LytB domain-containing protein [Candidatus Eremiobacteraeota bacterium]